MAPTPPEAGTVAYALSLAAFGAGLLSKSIALTLPVSLLSFEFFGPTASRALVDWRKLMPWHLPFWLLSGLYLFVVRQSAGRALGEPVRGYVDQLLTQLKALVYYGYLVISPVALNVEQQFFTASSGAGMAVVLSGLGLLSMAWKVGGSRWRGVALPLSAAVLSMLPTLIVPLNVLVNEHRIYLALALVCALGVAQWSLSRRDLIYALIVLSCIYGLMSHQRNTVWADELSLWRDAVDKAPEMYRAHMHLGGAYQAEAAAHFGKPEGRKALLKAQASHERAAMLAPGGAEVHYNLGTAARELGEHRSAVDAFETSLSLAPTHVPTLLNLGLLYGDLGQHDTAIELLSRGLRESPERVSFHYGLGKSHDALGNGVAAAHHYSIFVALDQEFPEAVQFARRRLQALAGASERSMESGER